MWTLVIENFQRRNTTYKKVLRVGQTQAQNKRQGVVQSDFKFQLSRTLVSVYLSYDQGRDK